MAGLLRYPPSRNAVSVVPLSRSRQHHCSVFSAERLSKTPSELTIAHISHRSIFILPGISDPIHLTLSAELPPNHVQRSFLHRPSILVLRLLGSGAHVPSTGQHLDGWRVMEWYVCPMERTVSWIWGATI
jgi:hypothetical protein